MYSSDSNASVAPTADPPELMVAVFSAFALAEVILRGVSDLVGAGGRSRDQRFAGGDGADLVHHVDCFRCFCGFHGIVSVI